MHLEARNKIWKTIARESLFKAKPGFFLADCGRYLAAGFRPPKWARFWAHFGIILEPRMAQQPINFWALEITLRLDIIDWFLLAVEIINKYMKNVFL